MASKLDLMVIGAVIGCTMLWIEGRHRVTIDAPVPVETSSPVSACPDSDTVPYSTGCLAFLRENSILSSHRAETEIPMPAVAQATGPACPDNDNVPYSANCLAFLKGATEVGMRWRTTAPDRPAALRYKSN